MRPAIPFYISFIFKLYFIGLLVFGLFRIALLLYVADDSVLLFDVISLKSFLIGLQFDTVVLAYLLAVPFILLGVQSLFKWQNKSINQAIRVWLCGVFPVSVFLTIADIPYFKFFHNRLSESSLQWLTDINTVWEMIAANTANLLFLIAGFTITILSFFLVWKFCRRNLLKQHWINKQEKWSKSYLSIYFLLFGLLIFQGMRGKISRPIRQGDAFYCNNPILNQMGLNPVFTLIKSYSDKVSLMEQDMAIRNTQLQLKIDLPIESISPIARAVKGDSAMKKHHIVLVLMEGMSANFMETFGNKNNLTPTLDSLTKVSWFFKNAYSAGIHTNNGVFSTLFSFPALKRVRPMITVPVRTYSGLPYILKQQGYRNFFFSTHAESFDNLGNFIPDNFFDELYTSEDYPAENTIGPFGVPDDYLFTRVIDELNKVNAGQPFFTTILTASNHDPYVLPDYFSAAASRYEGKDRELQAVSYADWAIGKFLTEARQTTWFDNTLFVFVSDHGRMVGENPYDLALSYNHIPIIFYGPRILAEPKEYDHFIGQIDIFPTIMGLLNAGYINNTLGVDVLKEKRECIYFSADDKMGCIDDEWLYIYRYGGGESLHRYKTGNTADFSKTQKEVFESLRKYALSQTQMAEWMITNNKTSLVGK